jgi:hypothetical protein
MVENRWSGRKIAMRWKSLVLGTLFLAAVSSASAAESEVREFTIHVDGKHAGSYQMTITSRDNGVTVMSGKAEVRLKVLFKTYVYTYDGTEVWKHHRLDGFRSNCFDDGKRFQVAAEAVGKGLRVSVNGSEYMTRGEAWLTSYWHLPEAKYRNQPIPLVEADTGKLINGRLHYIGAERMVVGGETHSCQHYRVTGGPSPVDLWFDARERLVRQDYMDDGHRTILQLRSIRR